MFSLEIECAAGERDLVIAEMWEAGSAGMVELGERGLRAFFDDDCRGWVVQRFPGTELRAEETQRDWVQAARDLLQPMEVGARFFLVPQWRDDPAPEGRFRITVNPGMAFGTGVHETTRLCMEALEVCLKPGMAVLDVGTGSGILAEAAELLGAGAVFACDTDPVAVEIAERGFVGSIDAVASACVDLVMANISPEAILKLAPDLMRVLRPGGVLLASGFEVHETDLVQAALPAAREIQNKELVAAGGLEDYFALLKRFSTSFQFTTLHQAAM